MLFMRFEMDTDRLWDVYIYGYILGAGVFCLMGLLGTVVGLCAGLLAQAHVLPDPDFEQRPGLVTLSWVVLLFQQLGGFGLMLSEAMGWAVGGGVLAILSPIFLGGAVIGFWPMADACKRRKWKPAIWLFLKSFVIPGTLLLSAFAVACRIRPWSD